MKADNQQSKVLALLANRTLIRSHDLDELKVPRAVLSRMVKRGQLVRLSRGLYASAEHVPSEHASLVEVARRYPKAVISLISALQYHQLTTQIAHEAWVAIPNKGHVPSIDYPPIRVVRFSGKALTEGVETHKIDGVSVRVTNVAKTIADCFKFRNKIGLDVALEALNEAWREKRVTIDELWRAAEVCRVANIIRPYLEGLTS